MILYNSLGSLSYELYQIVRNVETNIREKQIFVYVELYVM